MTRAPAIAGLVTASAVACGCRALAPFGTPKLRSEVAVAAWAEPSKLPPGGGQVQVLVRIRRPNGEPYPGVQVRLKASEGTLFSAGRTLVTDAQGMTRDRLTSRRSAQIVVLVGDTRHKFRIPVAPRS